MADDPRSIRLKVEESPRDVGPAQPKEKHRDFLALALKRFKTINAAESELRKEQLDDLKFRASDQWPENIRVSRENDGRPCLTVNRLPQFIRQVTNQQRQQRPAIEVNPVGDQGDPETAEIIQGIIRHIETASDADIAYAKAGEDQATMGRGYWRVITQYVDDDSFELEARIKRIRNQFSVYIDPACQEFDASDARYAFIVEDMPAEEFTDRFGDAAMASLQEYESTGDWKKDWMPEGSIRVAEYFYLDNTKVTKLQVERPDGTLEVIRKDLYEQLLKDDAVIDGVGVAQLRVVNEREVDEQVVKWCLISGAEILEGDDAKARGREWPGSFIPIVRVLGDEIELDGKVDYRGMVRDARDPQQMYNFWVSAETEMIALAPRAPYIGAFGQFEGHEDKWEEANNRNFPYLEYNPVDALGNAVGPPQRQQYDAPVQSIVIATQQADMDLKSVLGFENPSLGMLSPNERSGKAIQALQKQGEMGSSHYLDNLARAIRYTGRILLDMIPRLYDVPRIVRILGKDEKPKQVAVFANQDVSIDQARAQVAKMQQDVAGVFDLNVGRYDVAVSVGPSFQSRRQEAVETLTKFVEAFPDSFPVIGDLIAGNMDWPGNKQVSERLKQFAIKNGVLPPDDESDDISPIAAAQIQQLTMQLQEMQAALGEAQMAMETERQKAMQQAAIKREEIESKERIAALQAQVELMVQRARMDSEENRTLQTEQGKRIDKLVGLLQAKVTAESRSTQESKKPATAGTR